MVLILIAFIHVTVANFLSLITEQYCVRPITANAYADTPLNSFGTVATYECVPGFKYGDNTTVKTFECKEGGWVPDPAPCLGETLLQCML